MGCVVARRAIFRADVTRPVPRRRRLQIALALGVLAGLRTWLVAAVARDPRDFEQIWFAARMLLQHRNPYQLVGPGLLYDMKFGFAYPLTAGVAALPLTSLSSVWASVVFVFIGGALFAWTLMEHGYEPLIGFMGAGMVYAAEAGQWSPLFSAIVCVPAVGFLFAAKPNIGAAAFAARPTWSAVIGAIVLAAIAFAFQPNWVVEWRRVLAVPWGQPGALVGYPSPIALPWGFLIALSLLRWRRPEARFVLALACVPQTTLFYETTPLFLVPRTWRQAALLVLLGYIVAIWAHYASLGATMDTRTRYVMTGRGITVGMYLPCVWMILQRRNEGSIPGWLEQRIAAWPEWARGTASAHA
jgi:uncharacterized protein (TIGR03382 family)